jgi:hypothetical protein
MMTYEDRLSAVEALRYMVNRSLGTFRLPCPLLLIFIKPFGAFLGPFD